MLAALGVDVSPEAAGAPAEFGIVLTSTLSGLLSWERSDSCLDWDRRGIVALFNLGRDRQTKRAPESVCKHGSRPVDIMSC